MTDWGVPDWKDPANYGDTNVWSDNRWRWEFLRRRADIRKEFELLKDEEGNNPDLDGLTFDEPGFFVFSESLLGPLPNPSIGDQPERILDWSREQVHGIPFDGCGEPLWEQITFSLGEPLEPQLKAAKNRLVALQRARLGHAVQKREHRDKWLLYLRVLDARDAGVTWAGICTILKNKAKTEQAARDTYKQAYSLCFNL